MNEPVLSIRGLSKRLAGRLVVWDLTLDVYPGEVFGLLGPNGAGKTTTIRMALGLARITAGEIRINGHSVGKARCKALAGVGGIVENPELYKYLSGWDNLVHFARMHGPVDKAELLELVEFVGLQGRIRDKVGTYSLGMKQRLGIAVSLVHHPSLLILDEPSNGLDPAGMKELRDNLKRLAKEKNIAVLISSHLLSEMEQICDRVGILSRGALLEVLDLRETEAQDGPEDAEAPAAYVLATDDPEKATELLTARGVAFERLESGEFALLATKTQRQELLGCLLAGGVGILELRQERRSLEETYLEKMGGSRIG